MSPERNERAMSDTDRDIRQHVPNDDHPPKQEHPPGKDNPDDPANIERAENRRRLHIEEEEKRRSET